MVGNHRAEIVLAGPLDGFFEPGDGTTPADAAADRAAAQIATSLYDQYCPRRRLSAVQALRMISTASSKRAAIRHRHAIHVVFARARRGRSPRGCSARHGVGHRQLFGDAERCATARGAEHQELQFLRPLRGDRRHHVRRVHHACGVV